MEFQIRFLQLKLYQKEKEYIETRLKLQKKINEQTAIIQRYHLKKKKHNLNP